MFFKNSNRKTKPCSYFIWNSWPRKFVTNPVCTNKRFHTFCCRLKYDIKICFLALYLMQKSKPTIFRWRKCILFVLVLVAQSCLTLCSPMDSSLPGSSAHGVLQARILEWVAISFSRGSSQPRDWTWVSCVAGRFFTVWATREPWS